jgi:glycosyltransferase involved in cell wall biosynthesis
VRFLRHDRSLGASAARNAGLDAARGDFVAFLDDDDYWVATKLERQVSTFIAGSPGLGIVGCGFAYEAAGRIMQEVIPVCRGNAFQLLLRGNLLGSTSLPLIRSSALRAAGGFDLELPSCQDWDLWLRLARHSDVAVIPEVMVIRTVHAGQITGDLIRKIEGRQRLVAKISSDLACSPKSLAAQMHRLGNLHMLAGKTREAGLYYRKAIHAYPADLFSCVGIIMTYVPAVLWRRIFARIAAREIGGFHLYH